MTVTERCFVLDEIARLTRQPLDIDTVRRISRLLLDENRVRHLDLVNKIWFIQNDRNSDIGKKCLADVKSRVEQGRTLS